MTLWQKLWARFKGWLFVAEEKEPEPVNEPAVNPVGRFSTTVYPPVLKRQPQTKTTDELLAEIRARKAAADAKEAAKQDTLLRERQAQSRVLRTPPAEPAIVHHIYNPEPVVDNTATNLLMMSMLLNNNSQPTVQVIDQPAQVEIIMPQVPQPVCEPVREEPIRYSRPEPVYCAPAPEPYRAPDPEPTYSSPEPSYTDTSSSDSSYSSFGD